MGKMGSQWWKGSIVLLVLAAVTVTLSLSSGDSKVAQAAAPVFKDISGHWAKESIEAAVKAGILNGYPDQTYKPQNPITRAELLKVIALTTKVEAAAAPAGKPWYTGYQMALTDAKIYAAGDFTGDLSKEVTRVEMAKLAIRGANAEYRGTKLTADELMFRAVNAGLLSRTGAKAETIDPDGTTTRAQAAVIVTRLLKLAGGGKLTVDQGASTAAEVKWHRHNMITMFGQDDLVKFPYRVNIDKTYDVIIDQLLVLDPSDKDGYYAEYLDDAKLYLDNEKSAPGKGYVFAYKLIGKNLIVDPTIKVGVSSSFYMFNSGASGGVTLKREYYYSDRSMKERPGLFINQSVLTFDKKDNSGHNFYFSHVSKDFIKSQIKEYGGVPIHLERYGSQLNNKTQFYLTEVKDKWAAK
ncbi:S-layer homology domain-containing protein [Paenibacillus algorifonticola]|uniref:S-layer homology domain-containing protein n=1 Tax=Paenibacillus algorifonticola TaxID=684063 RepID=A0A1I2F5Y3_9BACL|nr:S-layer homology domain-containing protein [Paenibacillus algorifonticola]SFF00026.1 S-layer homology domain-containing protein [Paenibacillus algorifonticola]